MSPKQIKGMYAEQITDSAEWFTTRGIATESRFGVGPRDEFWWPLLTPIEQDMWEITRGIYGQFLLPQWPVCSYFLDFANPITKIAFECDGKQWHDKERDDRRDTVLREHGWTVYRFPGSLCHKRMDEPSFVLDHQEQEEAERWREGDAYRYIREFLTTTLDGFMQCYTGKYFAKQYPDIAREVMQQRISSPCKTLPVGRKKCEFEVLVEESFKARQSLPLFDQYLFCIRARQNHLFSRGVCLDLEHMYKMFCKGYLYSREDVLDRLTQSIGSNPILIKAFQNGVDPRQIADPWECDESDWEAEQA